ncbi:response regulator transcription factor [Luteimonas qiangzhengi]|uniref:response regulator transcription factor n=1 Tax=Luteimonas sp. MJ146 TaxID=3129240 RepID=UPI0031BA723E
MLAEDRPAPVQLAVVEDDIEFREQILLPILLRAGFAVTGMGSALELYRDLLSSAYDLVLLDLGLPDEDGLSIARRLREQSPSLGIVMLSGAVGEHWRQRALEAGVDAWLAKPADMDEVVATLRNLAGRVARERSAGGGSGWKLAAGGWLLVCPEGAGLDLGMAEREVLALLADNPGAPVSREALIARLSGPAEDFDPHRLEMLVYRLRRKCRQELGQELPLKAVRGVGYMLAW